VAVAVATIESDVPILLLAIALDIESAGGAGHY
jgi:hypothetical protein